MLRFVARVLIARQHGLCRAGVDPMVKRGSDPSNCLGYLLDRYSPRDKAVG
jgi:hypothetical protein